MTTSRLDANTHTYYLNDEPMRFSVTQLISRTFPPFPAQSIATRVALKRGTTREAVLSEWRDTATKGTQLHEDIHHYLNGLHISNVSSPFQSFLQFLDHHPDWDMMRTEMVIANRDIVPGGLAGSIDAWFRDRDGDNHLVDWKRTTKDLEDTSSSKKALDPISHLSDSNFSKYSLQLNLYKRLLFLSHGIKVHHMWIVQLNPLSPTYKKIRVPDLDREIDLIVQSPELKL
jgi:ATP-dependent exoDNAse (exonuclease V) beta subunit